MSGVDIQDLFHHNRFPRGLAIVPICLYFPLGIILALVRFFIGVHAFIVASLLPKTWQASRRIILRCMCTVLGIVVTQEGRINLQSQIKIVIANNISMLDHLAIDLMIPHVMPSVWNLPPALNWLLGYTDMGVTQGREQLIVNAKKHCQESPLPIFTHPEGASTNGSKGLLKFSVWPFSLGYPVQPVLVKVSRPPFVGISPSVLGGRWWVDTFWFLFVPYTRFHLRILPLLHQTADEDADSYSKRAQDLMSRELEIVSTPFTSADKVEYAKRALFIEQNAPSPPRQQDVPRTPSRALSSPTQQVFSPRTDTRLNTMARQVKEVLPHVPLEVIKRDLGTTKDVDTTITNILEGRIANFTPEDPTAPNQSMRPEPACTATPQKSKTAASSFAKSSKDRMKSFQERKREMIEIARKKYMAKHGLS